MNKWRTFVTGVVGGLLGAGLLLLITSPPRGDAVLLEPPPPPAPIVVHVAGAVMNPGVYTLPNESRVADALEAAGGTSHLANPQTINLAARLEDGNQVWVPTQADTQPGSQGAPAPPLSAILPDDKRQSAGEGQININTASQADLESLPGIGPATAVKIIAYREDHGPFSSLEAIQNVSGIGPATYEQIKALITIAP